MAMPAFQPAIRISPFRLKLSALPVVKSFLQKKPAEAAVQRPLRQTRSRAVTECPDDADDINDNGNFMTNCIFLIGPGGAGKSTVGKFLSDIIGYIAVDLDNEFCERIINIRQYIKSHDYESYLEQNSQLLKKLLIEYAEHNALFVLSSGFLSTDISLRYSDG